MDDANLYGLFRSHFPPDPAAPFLEDASGDVALGYGELDATTARLAHRMRRLGVEPGDRVMVQVEKSAAVVSLYLACLRAGAVHLPLNPAYTDAEVEAFAADAGPRLLVCDPARAHGLAGAAARGGACPVLTLGADGAGSLLDGLCDEPADPLVVPRVPEDPAALLYTSGTTGRAKGAVLSHANLAENARALRAAWAFERDDVLLHALPLFHAHGLFVALHCVLLSGSRCRLLPRFDAAEVAALLTHATVFMGVPTFYTRLLGLPSPVFGRASCRRVRLFVSGSAPLAARVHRAFEARTGHRILERYGMTEVGMITSNPLHGERVAGSVGFALPGVELRVCDREGRALPPGRPGVLEIRGPNVFRGYWRRSDATRESFRPDGFFVTGDLAELDGEGRVTLVGRARDLVISGGLNVYPAEVERALDAVEGVRESAVIGVPHPDLGEGVAAVVVREPGTQLDARDLVDALAGRLARFKQPRRVFFVEALPRNTMGKVEKNALRERFGDAFAEGTRPSARRGGMR